MYLELGLHGVPSIFKEVSDAVFSFLIKKVSITDDHCIFNAKWR